MKAKVNDHRKPPQVLDFGKSEIKWCFTNNNLKVIFEMDSGRRD